MACLHPDIFSNNIVSRGPVVHTQGPGETHPGLHRAAAGERSSLILQRELDTCSDTSTKVVWNFMAEPVPWRNWK